MEIYASFGIPELWRVDRHGLRVYELSPAGKHVLRETSLCLPGFPIAKAKEILLQLGSVRQTTLVRSFRDWVRKNVPSGDA